jgi:hypothetical protein
MEALLLDKAGGETECHRGVISPFTRLQMEGAPADHVGDERKSAASLELDCGSYCIAAG